MIDDAGGEAARTACSAPTLDAWSWIARARAAAQRVVAPAQEPDAHESGPKESDRGPGDAAG
jgi:hypothetical protein